MNPYYNPNPAPSGQIRTSISNPPPTPFPNDWQLAGDGGGNDFNYGGAATGALGAATLAGDWAGMAHQNLGLSRMERPSTSSYSGDYYNQARHARIQKLGGAELVGGALKGAAAGTAILPGVGTAIGAGIGAIGTIFASRKRRRRQESEKSSAIDSALGYQSQYNTAQNTADQQQTSSADYQRRLDQYTQNLYSWNAI